MPRYSLRGEVIKRWKEAGSPQWDYEKTEKTCLEVDNDFAEQGQNPAPSFREKVRIKDQSRIRQWVRGCCYPWLNPRKPKVHGKQHNTPVTYPIVKKIGDEILNHANSIMDISSGDDADLRFRINRWVYSRLQRSEIMAKRPIKEKLWESGMRTCQAPKCNKVFESLRDVEIHRVDQQRRYSMENCILMCRECHRELGKGV